MKLGGNYPVTRPCVNSTVLYCEMCGATKVNPSPGLDPIISIFVDKLPRRTQLVHEAALSRARIEATTEAFEDEDSHVRVYPPAGLREEESADIEGSSPTDASIFSLKGNFSFGPQFMTDRTAEDPFMEL